MDQKHTCCVESCKRNFATENVLYFSFPLHDEILLSKWLSQVGRENWKPTKETLICSKHFLGVDIDSHPNRKVPVLKPTAVPKIFSKNVTFPKTTNNSNLRKSGGKILSPGNVTTKKIDVARKKTNPINIVQVKQNNQVFIPEKQNDQTVVTAKQNIQVVVPVKQNIQTVGQAKQMIQVNNNNISPLKQTKPMSILTKNQSKQVNILPVKQINKISPSKLNNTNIIQVKQSNQVKFSPVQKSNQVKTSSSSPAQQLNQIKIVPIKETNQTHVLPMAQSNIKNLPIGQLNLLPLQQNNLMSSLKSGSVCFLSSPPGSQPLRKILPKAPIGTANGASTCIIVIPTFDNTKPKLIQTPITTKPSVVSQSTSKKVNEKAYSLRITVAKKCNNTDKNDDQKTNSLKTNGKLEIKNKKDKTMITFSVDPATGKIVMEKRKLTNAEIADKNLRQRQKITPIIKNDPAMNKIKRIRSKEEAKSRDLKTNIRELRQTRMRSQEKIKKLQAEIDEVQEQLSPKPTIGRKRRIGMDGKITEVDVNPSPVGGKKIKIEVPSSAEVAAIKDKNALKNIKENNASPSFESGNNNVIESIEFVDINNLTSPTLKPGNLSLKSEFMS